MKNKDSRKNLISIITDSYILGKQIDMMIDASMNTSFYDSKNYERIYTSIITKEHILNAALNKLKHNKEYNVVGVVYTGKYKRDHYDNLFFNNNDNNYISRVPFELKELEKKLNHRKIRSLKVPDKESDAFRNLYNRISSFCDDINKKYSATKKYKIKTN